METWPNVFNCMSRFDSKLCSPIVMTCLIDHCSCGRLIKCDMLHLIREIIRSPRCSQAMPEHELLAIYCKDPAITLIMSLFSF